VANECIPIFEPGGTPTGHAAAGATGKRFLRVSAEPTSTLLGLAATAEGGNMSVAMIGTQGQRSVGVADRDVASGGKVGVISTPGIYVPVTAGAAVVAGQEVMSDNQGRAIPYVAGAGVYALGECIQGQSVVGQDCVVRWYGSPVRGAGA
jgi:hypothetical protein